jgi:ABC-2 type transport system ATP-binding protein
VDYTVEGLGLVKSFVKKRPIRDVLRRPFHRERVRALRGVDLQVRHGEIFGLLGPNGAGKTTLLKILSCLVLPDEGSATVCGVDTIHENRVKPMIGLVNTDERSFYWRLSGAENLRFFATLYDVPRARFESRIAELLELVDMAHAADQRFAEYSAGMKQRLAIARALLHDPPILLMDEPTRSLDPAASLSLRGFIADQIRRGAGKTIVLATHNLAEAEALCDRLAIVVAGTVRETGTPTQIRRLGIDERRFRLEARDWPEAPRGPFRVVSSERVDGVQRVVVALDDGAELDDLLRALLQSGVRLLSCDKIEPDLEQAFTRILDQQKAADAAEAKGSPS